VNANTQSTLNPPLRIVRSESVELKQKVIRDLFIEHLGSYESVLELGGMVRDGDIIITDALIPRATVGHSSFRVKDRDLSACWSAAAKSDHTRHLKPVGDLHYHPGRHVDSDENRRRPQPSGVDRDNSLRQAGLYFPFNLQTTEREVELTSEDEGAPGGHFSFIIDSMRSIRLRSATKPASIVFRESEKRSLWASLIYPSDGHSASVGTSVIVHAFRPGAVDEMDVSICDDVPTVVLSDEQVAELTSWPVKKIGLRIEPDDLISEIKAKYRAAWGYDREKAWGDRRWQALRDERPSDWSSDFGYPVVLQAAPSSCWRLALGRDHRRDGAEMARMLRVTAGFIDRCQAFDGDVWNPRFRELREEAIWNLVACIQWLRCEQPVGEA
jgi:hypothetical protein